MKIFIDTSAWVAIENKRDIHYDDSIQFKEEIKNRHFRLYTSNYVLDETYTLLLANVGYEKTVDFIRRIKLLRNKGLLFVIQVTDEIEETACSIFDKFNKDKFWSFTDCTSKVIMEILDIKQAFSFDKNFEQMGFEKRP